MKRIWLAAPILVAFLAPVQAEERIITVKAVGKMLQVKDGEMQFFAATFTPDGRIGTKEYTYKPSEGGGQSTYHFEEGSVTTAYTLSIEKGIMKGQSTVVSGTGAYAGAKGTGTIDGRDHKTSGLKGASLINTTLKLELPKGN